MTTLLQGHPTDTPTPDGTPQRPRRQRRLRAQIFASIDLTAEQLAETVKALAADASQALSALAPKVPQAFTTGKVIDGVAPGQGEFVIDMASVKDRFPAELGHLPFDSKSMRQNVALAGAAQGVVGPLRHVLTVVENIANYANQQALSQARSIYQHAAVGASLNPALAEAIGRWRDARNRVGKKALISRVRNALASAVRPSAEPVPPVPSSSTTVTTTQR